jgi:hypothetical protein
MRDERIYPKNTDRPNYSASDWDFEHDDDPSSVDS